MAQVISNKVYDSIQPYTSVKSTSGTILYANAYAGIPSVSMDSELKSLLDSDVGLNGTNLLVQLKQKFKFFRNGPWYVDSRDGVIYIHNRKFKEEPVHTYVYQNENGEVLQVQFSTQYITKSTKVVVHETINPADKGLEVIQTTIDDLKEKEDILKNKELINSVDNTFVAGQTMSGWETYATHPDQDSRAWQEVQSQYQRKNQVYKETKEIQTKVAEDPTIDKKRAEKEFRESLNAQNLNTIINEAINAPGFPDYKRKQLQILMNDFQNQSDPKKFEALLKQILDGVKYTFDGEDQIEYQAAEWVDPKDYSSTDIAGTRDPTFNTWLQRDSGLKNLRKDPWIEVKDVQWNRNKIYHQMMTYKENTFPEKVLVIHKVKRSYSVPLYDLYMDYYSRYGGVNRVVWAANANANGGLKKKEKVLNCSMTVVGRPLLESSMVINLQNVGRRWSGLWYIKKCVHRMDAGIGYTCELSLVKNSERKGFSTTNSRLGTENVLHVYTDKNGKTVYSKKDPSLDPDVIMNTFSREEKEFANQKYGFATEGSDTKTPKITSEMADNFVEDFAIKDAYNIKNANDPYALAAGTVRVDRVDISSTKGVTYLSPAVQLTPGQLGISQEEINLSKKSLGNAKERITKAAREAAKKKRKILSERNKNLEAAEDLRNGL